jgi:TonB family protein
MEGSMRNLTRPFGRSAIFASVVAFLFSGSFVLAQDQPGKTSETVYEARNGVTAPKLTRAPKTEFSEPARGKKVHGVVELAMIVTAEGKVRDAKVTKSLEEDLDKRAVAAVSAWRFEPGAKDGRPVAVHLRAQVEFNLY